jgi:hypothetical protein
MLVTQGEAVMDKRSEVTSFEPNNTDVFVWALYLLNGSERAVDVEEIYLKVFEIAPLRFGWRTRPDLPNFKKTAKALQEVEAKSHVGLLLRSSANLRRLTPEGKAWVLRNRALLEAVYGGKTVAAPANSDLARQMKNLKSNQVYAIWQSGKSLTLTHLSVLLNCSKTSADAVWRNRLADLTELADQTNDAEILRLSTDAKNVYEKEKN